MAKVECHGYLCQDRIIRSGDQVIEVRRGRWIIIPEHNGMDVVYSSRVYHRKCYPGGK
jgi:hypothetical protein